MDGEARSIPDMNWSDMMLSGAYAEGVRGGSDEPPPGA